jgi:hypothetical protein
MDRPILSIATGIAVGTALALACRVPDTLGLPCETDAHCDGSQVCADGVCAPAGAGSTSSTGTVAMTSSSSGDVIATSSTGAVADDSTSSSSSGPAVDSTTTGDVCGVGECVDLDVLVVLDNSPSMYQWLLPLASSLDSLVALISAELDAVCTYHVGIVTGDPAPALNSADCQQPGALIQVPATCSETLAGSPWLSDRSGPLTDAVEIAKCTLIEAGTGGPDDEIMLESMMASLDPLNNEPGTCNAGFRRPDAHLLMVYLSDEDDPTPIGELDTLADDFETWVDASRTAFISVVADDNVECPWDPSGTDSDGSGALVPTKLNGFLALTSIPLTQRATVDICEMVVYDFAEAFEVIAATCGG